MPAPSIVARLPDDVREEIDRRLAASAWSGYAELSAWLASQGYEISVSSLGRYGRQAKDRLAQIRAASEFASQMRAALPDDDGAESEATLRLIQSRFFQLQLEAEDERDPKAVSTAARALADLARAGIALRTERRKIAAEAADAAVAAARQTGAGFTEAHLREIRERVYGIVDG